MSRAKDGERPLIDQAVAGNSPLPKLRGWLETPLYFYPVERQTFAHPSRGTLPTPKCHSGRPRWNGAGSRPKAIAKYGWSRSCSWAFRYGVLGAVPAA